MDLSCPSCDALFRVSDDAFEDGARRVRCGKCGNVWRAEPPAAIPVAQSYSAVAEESEPPAPVEAPAPESAPFAEPAPVSESEPEPVSQAAVPSAAPAGTAGSGGFPGYASDSNVRYNERRGRGGAVLAWILFFMVVIGIAAGGWQFRAQIVERVPEAQKIYDLLSIAVDNETSGLELRGVTSVQRTIGGERRMVVEGSLVNVSEAPQAVPLLRAVVTDSTGKEVKSWDFDPGTEQLEPGGFVEFSTSTGVPVEGSQVDLLLVDR